MMFLGGLVQMGIGTLANMVMSAGVNAANQQRNRQAIDNLHRYMDEQTLATQHQMHDMWAASGLQMPGTEQFAQNMPQFPDEAAQQLQQRQEENTAERQQFTASMKDEFAELRSGFFDENHLEFQDGDNTAQEPTLASGKETPNQRDQRQAYEEQKNTTLADRQAQQRDTLMQNEKDQLQTFLQNNKPDLGNPAVQSELQKAIMTAHKKALAMTKDHEEETLKNNLYTKEQISLVDNRLGQLREMEERHAHEEDNSPEAQQLLAHQHSLAEALRQSQEKFSEAEFQLPPSTPDPFNAGPPRFNQSNQAVKKEIDVATVLPPYLANTLYNLGIYTV